MVEGPALGASELGASYIVVYVTSQNGSMGKLGTTPKAAKFSLNSTVNANVYVPNGALWIKQNSTATEAFLGKWAIIGYNVPLTLDSGW